MTLEVCIDSYEGALLARSFGAKRVELCSALSLGGLTPSIGLIERCIEEIEVHAMLRNREGNFVYSPTEIEIMLDDADYLAKAGASGIVFGCLTKDGQVDVEANDMLLKEVQGLGLEATFHRAFEYCLDPKESLEILIELGFNRILTSGNKTKAIEGIDLIRKLTRWSAGRIEIMAGSGVNASNALQLAKAGVDALHFTSQKTANSKDDFGMGRQSIPDEEKMASITKLFQ